MMSVRFALERVKEGLITQKLESKSHSFNKLVGLRTPFRPVKGMHEQTVD